MVWIVEWRNKDDQKINPITVVSPLYTPPKVLLLCCSWGACVPRRPQRLCQLEFWFLVGLTMLEGSGGEARLNATHRGCWQHQCLDGLSRWPCCVMPQSKSRLDIPWPNDAECIGLCPVLFVIWVPTTLWCRVPSLPRCWLGVHIRLMYCTRTPLPATQEWKWAGLKWSHARISKWKVRPPLPWSLTFRLSGVTSQTILGNPTPEVVEKCIPVGSSSRSPELGGLCVTGRGCPFGVG